MECCAHGVNWPPLLGCGKRRCSATVNLPNKRSVTASIPLGGALCILCWSVEAKSQNRSAPARQKARCNTLTEYHSGPTLRFLEHNFSTNTLRWQFPAITATRTAANRCEKD